LDYPIGSGFSRAGDNADYARNETDFKRDLKEFWLKFLEIHPEYKNRDIYVLGTSYGGTAAPYTAVALHELGERVKGVAVGNGWTEAFSAFETFGSFSYKYKNYTKLTLQEYQDLDMKAKLCNHILERGKAPYTLMFGFCFYGTLNNFIGLISRKNPQFSAYHMDWSQPAPDPASPAHQLQIANFLNKQLLPKNPLQFSLKNLREKFIREKEGLGQVDPVTVFLEQPKVQAELNNPGKFLASNGPTHYNLIETDVEIAKSKNIEFLLEKKIKVLVFYGDMDWICNYENGELMMDRFEWFGKEEWKQKELELCDFGKCKEFGTLRYVRFKGAGHNTWNWDNGLSNRMMNEFVDWKPE
jgi:pimeloyl-ACP methyl ester carboxylesterase